MPNRKHKVLFVGAFRVGDDGVLGGQLHACKTLLSSPISDELEFVCLDTTQRSLPPPSLTIRSFDAIARLIKFIGYLCVPGIKSVLIFSSSGFSLVEKGLMSILARAFFKKVTFCPRSGLIENDLKRSKFMRVFIRLIFWSSSNIICQSESWKNFYSVYCSDQTKLKVIKNWLDVSSYRKLTIRTPEKNINVVFIGWLEKNKGIFELWEAWQDLAPKFPNIRLTICGLGSEYDKLKERVDLSPLSTQVKFEGWVKGDSKLKVLEQSDIFVLPSHKEGLPNALLEAMASGKAVVSTKVGAIPDVLNGENGLLVEPYKSKDISEKLTLLIEDSAFRVSMSKKARQTILEDHDINILWHKLYKIL